MSNETMSAPEPHMWPTVEIVIAVCLAILTGIAKTMKAMVNGLRMTPFIGLARILSITTGGAGMYLLASGAGLNEEFRILAAALGGGWGVDVFEVAEEEIKKRKDKFFR